MQIVVKNDPILKSQFEKKTANGLRLNNPYQDLLKVGLAMLWM